jgi:hypothetical protein
MKVYGKSLSNTATTCPESPSSYYKHVEEESSKRNKWKAIKVEKKKKYYEAHGIKSEGVIFRKKLTIVAQKEQLTYYAKLNYFKRFLSEKNTIKQMERKYLTAWQQQSSTWLTREKVKQPPPHHQVRVKPRTPAHLGSPKAYPAAVSKGSSRRPIPSLPDRAGRGRRPDGGNWRPAKAAAGPSVPLNFHDSSLPFRSPPPPPRLPRTELLSLLPRNSNPPQTQPHSKPSPVPPAAAPLTRAPHGRRRRVLGGGRQGEWRGPSSFLSNSGFACARDWFGVCLPWCACPCRRGDAGGEGADGRCGRHRLRAAQDARALRIQRHTHREYLLLASSLLLLLDPRGSRVAVSRCSGWAFAL